MVWAPSADNPVPAPMDAADLAAVLAEDYPALSQALTDGIATMPIVPAGETSPIETEISALQAEDAALAADVAQHLASDPGGYPTAADDPPSLADRVDGAGYPAIAAALRGEEYDESEYIAQMQSLQWWDLDTAEAVEVALGAHVLPTQPISGMSQWVGVALLGAALLALAYFTGQKR